MGDTHRSTMREKPPPPKKNYFAAEKKFLECSEMARFQIKKIGGRHDGRRFRGHLLLLMSPKTSGVASPVESSNTKKNEKVFEFPESARFAKKYCSLNSPSPLHHNPPISE